MRLFLARVVIVACGYAFAPAASGGSIYYVDCSAGNDAADGLSESRAWKSVGAVSHDRFLPGDSILFRRGSTCSGMLWPKGSGSAGATIRMDAWGIGPLPKIQAEPGQEAAFRLSDQEYWTIGHLEFIGGEPHGVFISGTKGVLHGIHIQDIVVHDVTGHPKNKEEGLVVVAAGTEQQHFDGVLIEGVTAYHTSQWAGIFVGGVAHGFPPEASRNTNVVIRNCIVHDVAGDGIVLFQVNNGSIENSAAWLTGMQDTQTIGTPNAIWTWMCRNCAVRHNEAFLTDSPGVDGGAFDIDYGNADNIVEENYGHDTQGYCFAVFAAGWITTNSKVRKNICAANGLSPRLARIQGAVYLYTWNGGKIKGLEISNNQIFWNPPVATAALVNAADFVGKGVFEKNTIFSCSPSIIRSNPSLEFQSNSYEYCGRDHLDGAHIGSPSVFDTSVPELSLRNEDNGTVRACGQPRQWCLLAFVSAGEEDYESRGQVALLESIQHQFPNLRLEIVATGQSASTPNMMSNLRYDWNADNIPVLFDSGDGLRALSVSRLPTLILAGPSGNLVWRHDGFTPPGELGLVLRSVTGNPQFAEMSPDR